MTDLTAVYILILLLTIYVAVGILMYRSRMPPSKEWQEAREAHEKAKKKKKFKVITGGKKDG